MPTVRSFAELGTLFRRRDDRPLNARQRRLAAYRASVGATDQSNVAEDVPFIPCSACGTTLPYTLAVPRRLGPGHYGYAHPEGECDPADVRAWVHRRVRMQEFVVA
jgi:hypothetical protein